MIKANPFYHWVQSGRKNRPFYARVKEKPGTKCTNRQTKSSRNLKREVLA